MPTLKPKTKSRAKQQSRGTAVRRGAPQLGRRAKFSTASVLIASAVLAIAGISFVLLSQAGSKPYSRLDCTAKKGYMGVAGPSATPPIPGYVTRAGSSSTVPSRQACSDKSTEAMVAKIYRVVNNTNIAANPTLYQSQANQYIGLRGNPPAEYASTLLTKGSSGSGFQALSNEKKIDRLYQVVLNRAPDKQGASYWSGYLKTNGPAKTIPAFLAGSEALRKTQSWSNAALASLPATYRPEVKNLCRNGLNNEECKAYIQALQKTARDEQGEACKKYTKGGSVTPKCKIGSKGTVDDVLVQTGIDGSNVTLNVAVAKKFTALRQAAKREAGVNITAYDREGRGYGSFRTSKMQQLLVNRNIGAAPVGSSMHQWGLALDFGCDRKSYSNSGAKCQNWMKANAGRFGFYNLPSEAWHYSTNGR